MPRPSSSSSASCRSSSSSTTSHCSVYTCSCSACSSHSTYTCSTCCIYANNNVVAAVAAAAPALQDQRQSQNQQLGSSSAALRGGANVPSRRSPSPPSKASSQGRTQLSKAALSQLQIKNSLIRPDASAKDANLDEEQQRPSEITRQQRGPPSSLTGTTTASSSSSSSSKNRARSGSMLSSDAVRKIVNIEEQLKNERNEKDELRQQVGQLRDMQQKLEAVLATRLPGDMTLRSPTHMKV